MPWLLAIPEDAQGKQFLAVMRIDEDGFCGSKELYVSIDLLTAAFAVGGEPAVLKMLDLEVAAHDEGNAVLNKIADEALAEHAAGLTTEI